MDKQASQLLYGPRPAGSRPKAISYELPRDFTILSDDDYALAVCDLAAKARLFRTLSRGERSRLLLSMASEGVGGIEIEQPNGDCLFISPRRFEERNHVAIYYNKQTTSGGLIVAAGPQKIESFTIAESLLREPLKRYGVDYLSSRFDGRDLLKRIWRGEEIDFSPSPYGENYGRERAEIINNEAFYAHDAITHEQKAYIDNLIISAESSSNYIDLLAADPVGAQAIESCTEIFCQIKL